MRVLAHHLLRLLALVALVALLVGLPVAVVAIVGLPTASMDRWRDAWRTHRLDLDLVGQVGSVLFAVLWGWFSITAVAELIRVLPHRHDPSALPSTAGAGPDGLVRGLVRFMAVSAVGAGLVSGGMPAVGHAASASQVVHTVVPGDSYWEIAEGHLEQALGRDATGREVFELTETLIERNAPRLGHLDPTLLLPGETVVLVEASAAQASDAPAAPRLPISAAEPTVPVVTTVSVEPTVSVATVPAEPTASADTAPVVGSTVAPAVGPTVHATVVPSMSSDDGPSFPLSGLGGAVFLATGALAAVEGRRRQRLRASRPGSSLDVPTFAQARTELLLRSLDAGERIARMDLAVRAVSRDLASQGASILAVALSDAGDVRLFVQGAAVPSSLHWRLDVHTNTWRLPASVPLDELVGVARDGVFPCPALVHLGRIVGGDGSDGAGGDDLYLDLEAHGAFAAPAEVAGAVVAALALSPFRQSSVVHCVGVAGVSGLDGVESHPAGDASLVVERARLAAGPVSSWASGASTFAMRALSSDGESWDPEVVVVGGAGLLRTSVADVPRGAGLAMVVPEGSDAAARLWRDGERFVIEPLGLSIEPVTVEVDALDAVADLLASVDEPLVSLASTVPIDVPSRRDAAFVEPEWDLLVRMIGQVEVIAPDGRVAQFVRSKSLELIVWMSLHRERSTRSGARTDLWEVGVRSATFANVVSEARRALAELQIPRDGEDWIGRTLTDDLPLHPRILTDGDLLQARLEASRGLPHAAAIEVLQPGLELVTGLPFSSPCFAWVDSQGHTSSLVLLATAAATELAQHHLALGDVEGVFWATGQGLKVLAGHEELIALRMRAHASRGDLAGVRLEWEQYERALAADTWSRGELSQKLVSLRRDLLASPMAATLGA